MDESDSDLEHLTVSPTPASTLNTSPARKYFVPARSPSIRNATVRDPAMRGITIKIFTTGKVLKATSLWRYDSQTKNPLS